MSRFSNGTDIRWATCRARSVSMVASGVPVYPIRSRYAPRSPRVTSTRDHAFRVPQADPLLEIADVGQQRRTGCAKSKHSVLHRALAAPHRVVKVAMMLAVGIVTGRCLELLGAVGPHRVGHGSRLRILLAVFLQELVLYGLGECSNRVTRLGLGRSR